MSDAGPAFTPAAPCVVQVRAPGQVTLIDGQVVDSTSEAWRHECEARAVAHMPSTQQRHEYIEIRRRSRGSEAADALKALATRIRIKEVLRRDEA